MLSECATLLPMHHPSVANKVPNSPRSVKRFYWSFVKVFMASIVLISLSAGSFFLSWYPHLCEDLLVNQELLPVPRRQELTSMFFANLGREHMKKASVSVYGVGLNVFPERLVNVLSQLADLEQDFHFAQTILIDGESTNGAQEVMANWVQQKPAFRSLIVANDAPKTETDVHSPFFNKPLPREGRIAHARNLALQRLRTLPATDYLIVLDLDIVGFNHLGIWDGLGRQGSWDVLCANGIVLHGLYRDTYAFRTDTIFTNHHYAGSDFLDYNLSLADSLHYRDVVQRSKKEAQKMLDTTQFTVTGALPKPIPVNSCFGGLSMYKYSSVFGTNCQYNYRHKGIDSRFMLDCEHVLFHQCLRDEKPQRDEEDEHTLRVVASPHLKLWYGHSRLFSEVKWKPILTKFLPQLFTDYLYSKNNDNNRNKKSSN